MGETLFETLRSGLALGSVLAVAGAWSRAAQRGSLPHLGVGAAAGVGVMLANRAGDLDRGLVLVLLLLTGVLLGDVGARLDGRVRAAARTPGWPALPPMLADATVLGAALALVAALRPPLAIPFPFGPLGGRPGATAAAAAAVISLAGVWAVARRRGPAGVTTWRLAGAATLLAAALASGSLGSAGTALVALPTVVDAAGLAFRATVAAVIGRAGPWHAAAAGLVLGLAEGLLWLAAPTGWLAPLPAVAAGLVGLLALRGRRPQAVRA